MSQDAAERTTPRARRRRLRLGAAIVLAGVLAAGPVLAQGWWPWSAPESERQPPIPQEPVFRPAQPNDGTAQPNDRAPPSADQPVAQPPSANWSTKNPICLQLENRLVQDSLRTNQSRDVLPNIEAQMRQADQTLQQSDHDLERGNCYEYFLFSKTLRRTRGCVDLARQKEQAQRRLADLEAQRQQIMGSSERSYRDDIVRELARNNCGANYQQEARRQDRGPYSSIWQDEESAGGGGWTPYGANQSYATYRTICVRLCDGYFFPVSFSTLPSHFEQDAASCQSKCAAPVELYYYQNPGAAVDQSVALHTQEPYTSLKTAFRYRKELVKGCSCKEAEYTPPEGEQAGKRADTDATTGWEARSEPEAKSR
jgi:Protein of unknown function (DUF2865)